MKNCMFKLGLVGALVTAGMSLAQAADQPMVVISGDVTTSSCTVNASVNQNQISLGNFTADKFSAGNGIYEGLYTVADSKNTFSVGVANCAGTVAADDTVGLKVTGVTIGGQEAVYSGGVGATVGTAGASLAAPATIGGADALVKNGDVVPVFKYTAGDAAAADGSSVTFTTYMASASATPAAQHIVAPINFSIAYN